MANQVQQLTRGRSASESFADSTVCRATQVMQGNEILAQPMANMQLQGAPRTINVNPVGGFGRVPGPVPFNTTAAVPYNPEVRINPSVNAQMPTHSPMEIETTQAIPSFCTGMVTPAVSAYVTPICGILYLFHMPRNYNTLLLGYLALWLLFNLVSLFILLILPSHRLSKWTCPVYFTSEMNFIGSIPSFNVTTIILLDFLESK
jgi:hypothetical protein